MTADSSMLQTPEESLRRLVADLERWGSLFIEVAREKDAAAAEQILGGLVDWMGNGLIDGWLHLSIPVFESVSDLAEELFERCDAYLKWLREAASPIPPEARLPYAAPIESVLTRAQKLVER
jgi:hypothetical protein